MWIFSKFAWSDFQILLQAKNYPSEVQLEHNLKTNLSCMLLLFYPNQLIRNSVLYDHLSILLNYNLLKYNFSTGVLQLKLTDLLWNCMKLQHNPDSITMSMKNIFAHEPSNSAGDRGAITAWTDTHFQIDACQLRF